MKIKIIIIGIIFAAILSACFPIVSSIKPRVNPDDDQNYVPVADNFTVTYDDISGYVNFGWETLNPDYDYVRDGYVIIQKLDSVPTSVYDGYPVEQPWGPDDSGGSSAVDSDPGDGTISGPQAGYINYFGLFAFWKEDESANEIYINKDGSYPVLMNTEGYVFSGPVTASFSVWATVTSEAADDTYITNADQWFGDAHSLSLMINNAYTPTSYGCLWFDLDAADIGDATIYSAKLYLMTDNPFDVANYSVLVQRITSDWGSNSTWAEVSNDAAFVTVENQFEFPVTNYDSGGLDNFFEGEELKNIVQFWYDGGTNNGLRLSLEAAIPSAYAGYFKTSEAGVMLGPRLELNYVRD